MSLSSEHRLSLINKLIKKDVAVDLNFSTEKLEEVCGKNKIRFCALKLKDEELSGDQDKNLPSDKDNGGTSEASDESEKSDK